MELRSEYNNLKLRNELINSRMMLPVPEGKDIRSVPVGLTYEDEKAESSALFDRQVNIIMSGISKVNNQSKGCGSAISDRTGRFITVIAKKESVGSRMTDDFIQYVNRCLVVASAYHPERFLEVATATGQMEGASPTKASARAQVQYVKDFAKNSASPQKLAPPPKRSRASRQKLDFDGDTQVDSDAVTVPSEAEEDDEKGKDTSPVFEEIGTIKDKFTFFTEQPLSFSCALPSIQTADSSTFHKFIKFASSPCFLDASLKSNIGIHFSAVGHSDNHQCGYTFVHTFAVNPFLPSSNDPMESGLKTITSFCEYIMKAAMRIYVSVDDPSAQCSPVCISWHVCLSQYVFLTFPTVCLFCRFHFALFCIWSTLRTKMS